MMTSPAHALHGGAFRCEPSTALDQPAINRHRLIAEKLIVFNKLEQLSASNRTRVALEHRTEKCEAVFGNKSDA